jgi:predicted NUDIX family phosphoesterase
LGVLNDDSNEVGKVHIGLVLLLEGNSPAIRVKSELKSGILLTHQECTAYYDSMENWTQIVFKYLS